MHPANCFQTSRFQYVVWCVRGCSVLLSHLCMIIHSYIIKLSDADIIENLIIKKRKLVRCRDQPNNSRDTMHNMTLI